MRLSLSLCIYLMVIAVNFYIVSSQVPPRLNIPGAILVSQPKPIRQQRFHQPEFQLPPQRLRRPNPAAVRPVVEEPEEPAPAIQTVPTSTFDDEVAKLGISVLQNAVREAESGEEQPQQKPLAFRPERPLPVLRQDIRERQEQRPILRQEIREDIPQPRQQVRPAQGRAQAPHPQPPQQQFRQAPRPQPPPRQQTQYIDDDDRRTKKPVVQILRKYRTDNADGSITWGFENEDGTFKEETLGIDCVTRGKYGYIDPDGVRREYSYETGNKCDQRPEEEEDDIPVGRQPQIQARKPQPQFRPAPAQY